MNENVPAIDPERTILLVMDYQRGILNNLPDADEPLSRMAEAIRTARSCSVPIGYVRVAFEDADYAAIPSANKSFAAVAAGRLMPDQGPETAIHDRVAPKSGDLIVRKTRVGAFSTTDLDHQLCERKIDTLILAGLTTSGVVLSTIRDAADRDYRVYVLEDACSDRDREVHDLLVRKVFPRQAHVIRVADLPVLLEVK